MIHARGSMFARLLLLGSAAFLMAAQSSCSWNGGEGSAEIKDPPSATPGKGTHTGDILETTLTLKDPSGTVTDRFSSGEIVTFELSIKNRTNDPIKLTFPSAGGWNDFVVYDRGTNTDRWEWLADKVFAAVVTDWTLPANGTQVFTGTWNQVSGDGLVARGRYDAWGVLRLVDGQIPGVTPAELESPRVPFTVE